MTYRDRPSGEDRASTSGMTHQRIRRLVSDTRGDMTLAYVVVVGLFGVLVVQPSLIVAAVDRLSVLLRLFLSQVGHAF